MTTDRTARPWTAFGIGAVALGGVLTLALAAQGGAASTPTNDPSKLPAGSAASGAKKAASCAGCHGPGGVVSGANAQYPRLAGQQASYLAFQLVVLRSGLRPAGVMNQIAKGLSDQDIADLTAYFSSQKVGPAWPGQDAALVKQGKALFTNGDPKRHVTACAVCHGAQGQGVNVLGVPTIRHQTPAYVVKLLGEYKAFPDKGTGIAVVDAMHIVAAPLSSTEMKAVAAYLASMP